MFFLVFSLFSLLLFPNFPPLPPSTIVSKNSSENRTFLLSPRSTPLPLFYHLASALFLRDDRRKRRRLVASSPSPSKLKQNEKLNSTTTPTPPTPPTPPPTPPTPPTPTLLPTPPTPRGLKRNATKKRNEKRTRKNNERLLPVSQDFLPAKKTRTTTKSIDEHIIRGRGT